MAEVYCEECGFQGKWKELLVFKGKSDRVLCPDCGSGCITESDAVHFNSEFVKQEGRKVVE